MDLVRWEGKAPRDLWDAYDSLRGEMEDAMGLFRAPDVAGLLDRIEAPAVDLIETSEELVVKADLPGVRKEDLELSVAGTLLSIKGEKKLEKEGDRRRFFRKETWLGAFSRTIDLPGLVDNEKIRAELKDGVLTVFVPKREEAKPRIVAISAK